MHDITPPKKQELLDKIRTLTAENRKLREKNRELKAKLEKYGKVPAA